MRQASRIAVLGLLLLPAVSCGRPGSLDDGSSARDASAANVNRGTEVTRRWVLDLAPPKDDGLTVNRGTASVLVTQATHGSARVAIEDGPPGSRAWAFPDGEDGAAAALSVRSAAGDEQLEPGDRSFAFGAVFALDEADSGSASDDGDNLLQRGLFDQAAQYKVQVDDGRVSCVLRGAEGRVTVVSSVSVTPEVWYRAACSRVGDSVTVQVSRIGRSGAGEVRTDTTVGALGRISFAGSVPPPLAIGGKVDGEGRVVTSSSDQFDGRVAAAFYGIGTLDGLSLRR